MKITEIIESKGYLLADGAMGTKIFESKSLKPGLPPEILNFENPELIQSIHNSYLSAGSDIILTNTFGGNSLRLALHGLEDNVKKINQKAVEIARSSIKKINRPVFVAGSMGPTGGLLEPFGELTESQIENIYTEQAEALDKASVDVLWLETFSCLTEVRAALRGVKRVSELPIVVTMSYDTAGKTMMGVSGTEQCQLAKEYKIFALGANCGAQIDETKNAITLIRGDSDNSVVVFKPNAGIPVWDNGKFEYNGTSKKLASAAKEVLKQGPAILGGCCGSTPAFIKEIKKVVELNPRYCM
jgi:5-methyltetrahydrofolate--homocysteine methyltransferase